EVDHSGRKQHQMHREQPNRHLNFADLDVGRHSPAAFAVILEAQHEHRQAVEGKTPDHTESVGFAEDIHITPASQNGQHLQAHDQIHDAIAGAVLLVRTAEPVGEHAVFGNAVKYAVGADDRSVDGSGKNQESHYHHKHPENELQHMWPHHVHGHARNQIVFVNRDSHAVGNNHHSQQRTDSGEYKTEHGDDQGGTL